MKPFEDLQQDLGRRFPEMFDSSFPEMFEPIRTADDFHRELKQALQERTEDDIDDSEIKAGTFEEWIEANNVVPIWHRLGYPKCCGPSVESLKRKSKGSCYNASSSCT